MTTHIVPAQVVAPSIIAQILGLLIKKYGEDYGRDGKEHTTKLSFTQSDNDALADVFQILFETDGLEGADVIIHLVEVLPE